MFVFCHFAPKKEKKKKRKKRNLKNEKSNKKEHPCRSIYPNPPTSKEFLIEMWILNQQITFIT